MIFTLFQKKNSKLMRKTKGLGDWKKKLSPSFTSYSIFEVYSVDDELSKIYVKSFFKSSILLQPTHKERDLIFLPPPLV